MPQPEFDPTGIEVVGFDLDNTLYPVTPEMDDEIRAYICNWAATQLDIDPAEARRLFDTHHAALGSGSKSVRAMGLEPGDIVQEALENADIAQCLLPDAQLVRDLGALSRRYRALDILTGSHKQQTERKLGALAVSSALFTHVITGEVAKKHDGRAFEYWLEGYPDLEPDNFAYVGDKPNVDHEIPAGMGIRTILVNVKAPDPTLTCPQLTSIYEVKRLLLPNTV